MPLTGKLIPQVEAMLNAAEVDNEAKDTRGTAEHNNLPPFV